MNNEFCELSIGQDLLVWHPESDSVALLGKVSSLDKNGGFEVQGEVSGAYDCNMALECVVVFPEDPSFSRYLDIYCNYKEQTMVATMSYEAFNSEEYKQTSNVLPYAQIINPRLTKSGILPCGLAITEENAQAIGFKGASGWEKIDYTFKAGTAAALWITRNPRLVIVARSQVYLRLREDNSFAGSLKDLYKQWEQDKRAYKPFSRAFGFILNEKNELAHDKILSFSLNGASGASFNAAWLTPGNKNQKRSGLCYEVEEVFAQSQKAQYQAKNGIFHAHCIYQPILEADERGQGQDTSLVAATVDFVHPTAKTLKDFLLPPGNDLSNLLVAYHNEYKDWAPTPAKPLEEEEDDGYSGRPKSSEKEAYEDVNGMYVINDVDPPF